MPAVKPEPRLVSKQDAALALGISRPCLDRYISQGLPVAQRPAGNRNTGYLTDLDTALLWLGAFRQRRAVEKPPLEVRIFEAAQKRWWTLTAGLMCPADRSMIRESCLTTNDLIQSAYRFSRKAGRELEALVERMEAESD